MRTAILLAAILAGTPGAAGAEPPPTKRFSFEAEKTVDDMRALVRGRFAGVAGREDVRDVFVNQGGATLVAHPRRPNVEKYVYDIDLCGYYVWRWNISADYAEDGRLKQLYVNAEPVLGRAEKPPPPKKGPFVLIRRPRPQASKGESSLSAVVADPDRDPATLDDDLILTGVGPTHADPTDMGRAYPYSGELWRSIFDADDAREIAPYPGDCKAVDAVMAERLGRARAPSQPAETGP